MNAKSAISSLPASTRCITIPELRWIIIDLVQEINTLMALALTCKSFSGPALDILWRHLDGFERLIKCLPQSLWKRDKNKLEFQRTMTLDDWAIFCKYNYRVRSLVHRCHVPSYIHTEMVCGTEIWRALSCPPFSLPLLPNLTFLTWTKASDETFQYIQLFVTSQLTELDIQFSGLRYDPSFTFGPPQQSILSSIAKSCPSLSYFDFQEEYSSTTSVGDTSTVLQFWSHLTWVRVGIVSEAAILHLSDLPSLEVLTFTLPSVLISADTQKLLQRPVFRALQELDVTCKSLVNLATFLEKITIAPAVLSFTTTRGVDFAQALPDLISRLSNACTHSSLQELQLNIRVDHQLADPDASIEAASFQPLFAFRNLLDFGLKVDSLCVVRMDDASLLQMAKAWPILENLSITGYSRSSHQVTPHAFVLLLWHCPRLISVGIPVNWSVIEMHPIPREIPYQGFSHKALSHSVFGGSKISDPISIAAFISAIAPNLKSIVGDDDYLRDDDNHQGWEMVQNLVTTLPIIREQGMRVMHGIIQAPCSYGYRRGSAAGGPTMKKPVLVVMLVLPGRWRK
ncbi:uncharacterized protein EDB93DRAFT_1200816 [Suillus bovinus]|uniref:uncharacterized protein n=1 Tax=Suillus bovinus TaxID=48563 RepID=UPI001B87366A|nr:uncharacterized protein EDB93DRAFT_1200816 [Suillus bovinus]KAG2156864.1 hypothetical protein EDB93DRAFT_1200816 [Suillus bovinus]